MIKLIISAVTATQMMGNLLDIWCHERRAPPLTSPANVVISHEMVGSRAPERPGEEKHLQRGAIPSDVAHQRPTPMKSLQQWQTVTMEEEPPPSTDQILTKVDIRPPLPDPQLSDVMMNDQTDEEKEETKIRKLSELCHFPKVPEKKGVFFDNKASIS